MSSSDEEAVRGPGRNAANDAHDSGDDNRSPYGAGNDNMDDNDADLFGSDGEDDGVDNDQPHRTLDDEQLDSGDDENRYDRMDVEMEGAEDMNGYKTLNVQDIDLARAPVPTTHNGEVSTMHVPDFLTIESEEFNPETYISPAYSTAASSLCWRIDPKDGSLLQSNARIIQWSDGSMTLQLAHSPTEQYRIESKPLAPLRNGEYDVKLDSHVYLGAAIETASLFRLTSHVKYGLTVLPTTLDSDDAVRKLTESLAAASRGGKQTAEGTAPIIENDEDPLLGQRKAEQMERDAIRAERRRQQLADREAERGQRTTMGRPSGGLSIGGLEDNLSTRPRGKPRRPTNRRGEINTDDEEDYGRGPRNREDEYDEDDGFLVGSDEEIEEEEEDEEEEELEDEDADAEGEVDDEVAPAKTSRSKPETQPTGSPPARKKNRYVVDDEDEDE